MNTNQNAPVDVLAVELRKIPRGGKFKLPGDDESIYTRGHYSQVGSKFSVQHAASMSLSYLPVNTLVYRWRAK